MGISLVSPTEIAKGVVDFNGRYAEMDRALWYLSKAAREDLQKGKSSEVIEELIWTIKSWWGIQGVRKEVKRLAAEALMVQKWTNKDFDPNPELTDAIEALAIQHVLNFVSEMVARGVGKQEFSLASKVLHWLLSWQIPAYDSFVRKSLKVPQNYGHEKAYRKIVRWQYENARRLTAAGTDWVGDIEPRTPLRALDKYLWWQGGGSSSHAAFVQNPWEAVRRLKIELR